MASNGGEKRKMKKEASQTMKELDKKKGGKNKMDPFPTTIEGFKYAFNEKGQLRHTETAEPFQFAVSDNQSYNQKHYEALGEVITEKVYELLESEGKLRKQFIPVNSKKTEPCNFIFMSDDALTNPEKLMVLIHGSGVVRAGQWTRKLIINEDLDHGTQLPYIKRAMSEGYGVIVLNTNLNHVTINGADKPIRGSEGPEQHGVYVWKTFVQNAKAKQVAIVAHSFGGVVTVAMAQEFLKDFQKRVFAIAFTDSVHGVLVGQADPKVGQLLQQRAVNWVTSDKPCDTPMRTSRNDASRVSAGHVSHEWTSWAAFESVFNFFNETYKKTSNPDSQDEAAATQSQVEVATTQSDVEVAEEAAESGDEPMDTNLETEKQADESKTEDSAENLQQTTAGHEKIDETTVEESGKTQETAIEKTENQESNRMDEENPPVQDAKSEL